MSWREQIQREYEEIRDRFKGMSFRSFQQGDWLASYLSRTLEHYVNTLDVAHMDQGGSADYTREALDQYAHHIIEHAAKHCAVAGGLTASLASAATLSFIPTFGMSLPGIGATMGLAVMSDIGYSLRRHTRAIYELSALYGGTLEADEVEDCYLIFLGAMEVRLEEIAGKFGRLLNRKPRKVATYNARMIVRAGLRTFFLDITSTGGGNLLIRKLVERVNLRLLVPGVNVAIAGNFNRRFTRHVLRIANQHMRWRGAVVRPLLQIYEAEPYLDPLFVMQAVIVLVESGCAAEWSRQQIDGLRRCQSVLNLTDEEVLTLDPWFQRDTDALTAMLPEVDPLAAEALVELLTTFAALFPDVRYDVPYAKAIAAMAAGLDVPASANRILRKIGEHRRELFVLEYTEQE